MLNLFTGGFGTGYGSSNGGGAIKTAGGYAQRSAGPYAGMPLHGEYTRKGTC